MKFSRALCINFISQNMGMQILKRTVNSAHLLNFLLEIDIAELLWRL